MPTGLRHAASSLMDPRRSGGTSRSSWAGRIPGAGLWSIVTASTAFLLLSWNAFHYWDEFFYLFAAWAHSPSELARLDAFDT